ncbi:hypothetical protein DVH24_023597 [Malus domestica]|uniref:Uncharacterized protein n=1 Tax=Malus domestica TaxID=3750 RepID=A0A498I8B4_MALDO|nr:hypothetical protein DVH24_023597 [Malus domestica]
MKRNTHQSFQQLEASQPLPALLLLRLDFDILVANPRKQKLYIQVNDSLGFADLTIGTGEAEMTQLRAEDEQMKA